MNLLAFRTFLYLLDPAKSLESSNGCLFDVLSFRIFVVVLFSFQAVVLKPCEANSLPVPHVVRAPASAPCEGSACRSTS